MSVGRFKIPDAVTMLKGGKVLVAGGGVHSELYDAGAGTFAPAGGHVDAARYFSTARPLPDNTVFIIGGYDSSITASARGWVYRP